MPSRALALIGLSVSLAGIVPAAQPDAVFDAMQAELKRSMTLTLSVRPG